MKHIKSISIAVTLTMIFFTSAFAGNYGGYGDCPFKGGGMGKHMRGPGCDGCLSGRFLDRLDLTADQKDQVTAILDKYKNERDSLHTSLVTSHDELFKAIHNETFNESDIRKKHQAVSAQKEELAVLRAKVYSEIRPILTPAQIEALQTGKEKFKQRMTNKHGGCRWMQTDQSNQ